MTTNFTSVSSLVLCGVDQGQGHDAAHGGPHVTERLEEGDELLRLRQVHGVGGKRCKVMQTMQSLTSGFFLGFFNYFLNYCLFMH